MTVNETNSVTIYCNATGLPQPIITWSKAGAESTVISSGTELVFSPVRRSDSGTYICTASNGAVSNASASITLNVQCKYHIFFRLLLCFVSDILRQI